MAKPVANATFWIESGRLMMRSTYDPDFVTEMKVRIAPANRAWDGTNKRWSFDPAIADDIVKLAERYYQKVTVVEEGGGAPAPIQMTLEGDPYSILARYASSDMLTKLYKSAVVENHPDHGGSVKKMTEINVAWKAIRKERGI